MKIIIKLFFLIVLLHIFLAGCSDTNEDELDTTIVTTDNTATTAPVIAEVTAVTTPTNDTTPDYTFSSDEAGTITYGGSCSSSTTSATTGNNTITLASLSDGTYSNCTITVTDPTGNLSNTLTITSFIVDSTAETLLEVTAVTTPTNDTTPNYTFSTNEAGTITYGGSCSSSTTSAISGNNTITLVSLSDGTYSNCTITVTNSSANSVTLNISSFVIDTTAPTVTQETAVTTPTNDTTPNYTFSTNEAGTITYGGSCSSSTTSAISGDNTITLVSLSNGTYSNCKITVTDNSGNSVTFDISSFVIDTTLSVGTITGSVLSQDNNSALSGASVSFAKSGTTMDNTTTDSSGDFSQTLILGTYTLTYSKSGYLDETQSVTLATDNQTLVASTLKILSDSCTSGTISGTIKDAVNNNPVTGVSLSVRRGVNVTSGTIAKTDSTSNTGTYSLSSMSAGWYTVETSKSGYITSTFNVYACGDNSVRLRRIPRFPLHWIPEQCELC